MKIILSGGTGFLGTALAAALRTRGNEVVNLTRRPTISQDSNSITWDPYRTALNPKVIEGAAVVINLAGDNLASGIWTKAKKERILLSRIASTRALVDAMHGMEQPPLVFISASAIGIYGDMGQQECDEQSSVGSGFLAEVCEKWESEALRIKDLPTRLVLPRFGIVLSKQGGALKKMLPPFWLGLGGRLGSGKQYMSWISLEDCISALLFCLDNSSISGPINLVSPQPVTNSEFTNALGRALRRPTVFAVPGVVLKMLLGEMANETLLSSTRVRPTKLLNAAYKFIDPEIEKVFARF